MHWTVNAELPSVCSAGRFSLCGAGAWKQDARGRWQLQASSAQQLLRLVVSTAVTAFLLLVAAAVLAACLNFQGLIVPSHSLIYMSRLAAWGARAAGAGSLLDQVHHVLADSTYRLH